MMQKYTGIGSRETPHAILELMEQIGEALARAGWVLRSGAADGADTAFERGCDNAGGQKEIFLPWPGFSGHSSQLNTVDSAALDMAAGIHPAWSHLSTGAARLHARNCYQVLGKSLDEPSQLTICWTKDGGESEKGSSRLRGGTATAIALSERCSIPVFNLRNEASLKRLIEYLAALPSPVLIGSAAPKAARFVHGNWEHIFPGQHSATQVRFAFDRDTSHVTAMQVHGNSGWTNAARDAVSDLEDSLKNANEGAIEQPQVWGLIEASTLPDWAAPPAAAAEARETSLPQGRGGQNQIDFGM